MWAVPSLAGAGTAHLLTTNLVDGECTGGVGIVSSQSQSIEEHEGVGNSSLDVSVEAKMNAMTGIQADTVWLFNCYTSHDVSYKRKVKMNAMAMIQAYAVPQIVTSHKGFSVKGVNVSVHQDCSFMK